MRKFNKVLSVILASTTLVSVCPTQQKASAATTKEVVIGVLSGAAGAVVAGGIVAAFFGAQNANIKNELEEAKNSSESVKKRLDSTMQELGKIKTKLEKCEEEYSTCKAKLEQSITERKICDEKCDKLSKEKAELSHEKSGLEEKLSQSEFKKLSERHAELTKEHSALLKQYYDAMSISLATKCFLLISDKSTLHKDQRTLLEDSIVDINALAFNFDQNRISTEHLAAIFYAVAWGHFSKDTCSWRQYLYEKYEHKYQELSLENTDKLKEFYIKFNTILCLLWHSLDNERSASANLQRDFLRDKIVKLNSWVTEMNGVPYIPKQ